REIRRLTNGNALAKYVRQEVDRGVPLKIHYWELAGPLPPRHMRLALFSYTIRADEAGEPATISDLEVLDQCVAQAEFAKNLGVTVEAPKKPWWKIW
ncbi:MAG: hypothetical protein ACREP9_11640, partial [Candidatus Dormibacteraceae bacterium]